MLTRSLRQFQFYAIAIVLLAVVTRLNLEEDFRTSLIADLYSNPDTQYPVKDFPILARLLTEQYHPVARTAEGVIYRIR
jgi:hypothetical protein